jgi:hypothetical protein
MDSRVARSQAAVYGGASGHFVLFRRFYFAAAQRYEERNYLANWHKDTRTWSEILGPGVALGTLADVPAEYTGAPVHEGSLYRGDARELCFRERADGAEIGGG